MKKRKTKISYSYSYSQTGEEGLKKAFNILFEVVSRDTKRQKTK